MMPRLLTCHLVFAIALLPIVTFADPLPSDIMWRVDLGLRQIVPGPHWIENGRLHVALGVGSRLVEVVDGEIAGRSNPLPGIITAVERGDADTLEGTEFLVATKVDSLSILSILNGEDYSLARSLIIGIDERREIDDDTLHERFSRVEKITHLRWIGGESSLVQIAKSIETSDVFNFGGGNTWSGEVLKYRLDQEDQVQRVYSGHGQIWGFLGENLLVGSTHTWQTWEPVDVGNSTAKLQVIDRNDSLHERQLFYLYFEDHLPKFAVVTALTAQSWQGQSACFVSVSAPDTALLCVSNLPDLDSIATLDLHRRPIKSFASLLNEEEEGEFNYLLCIEEYGTIRILNPQTLRFLETEYTSPVGSVGVESGDFDGDGQMEMLGISGSFLICARPRTLGAPVVGNRFQPELFSLSAFPNPFNSSTTISYSLPRPGHYAIDVVDISGRLVARLSDGWKEAGSYREMLNGVTLSGGRYHIVLNASKAPQVVPVTLIK